MKKIIYIISFACLLLVSASCQKFLSEEKTTGYTVGYVYGSPSGLQLALNGIYALHKTQYFSATNQHASLLVAYRRSDLIHSGEAGGTGNFWAEWNPQYVVPGNAQIKELWNWGYKIISRCNDVITYSKNFEETPESAQAVAEAKCIRAYNYLFLFKSFGRIWLNDKAITPENVKDTLVYKPATQAEVMAFCKRDLDDAIAVLDWTNTQGRYNKAAASHLRMEIAMYEEDWPKALQIMSEIEACGKYELVSIDKVFNGADRNTKENYLVEQWSTELGGTCTSDTGYGHYLSGIFIAKYWSMVKGDGLDVTDLRCGVANGGYTYGLALPNTYLLNLYDHEKDKRYTEWYIFKYINHTSVPITYGKETIMPGEYFPERQLTNATTGARKYVKSIMPGCKKYWDTETRTTPGTVRGFQDIIMMRMAESYIWAAEAALKNNDQTLAKKYFNKTWMRAGNAEWTGNLTMDDIVKEQARELCFEGNRLFYLKRLGKDYARAQIAEHAGSDELSKDISTNYTAVRTRIVDYPHFIDLPIPQAQIDVMNAKGTFPQNEGY